tara:strand:- start:1592 stop:2110 length:519 start_codon:yes stop_codon:yes gene_type:complete
MTKIPDFLIPYFRTNHAGETGAVYIYKGILAISKNKDIIEFSQRHLKTESNHLKIISNILPYKKRSRLIFLWKILGYITGYLPALFGDKFVYATIYSVESFVEQHYQDQINLISKDKKFEEVKDLIKSLMDDEVDHKNEAYENFKSLNLFQRGWSVLVKKGSSFAVKVSMIV